MKLRIIGTALCLLAAAGAAELSDAEWSEMKRQALERRREVMYNTDGCDAVYFPEKLPATRQNFIDQRLKFALGSKVDTVLYCPFASGFGFLTSRTAAGDQMTRSLAKYGPKARNVTAELLGQGTDPLKITEAFCRANQFEFFVSLRCNDTHDYEIPELLPPFVEQHPQYLVGTPSKRPPHGRWSAVDFAEPAVRERFLAIVEELLRDYEVDGIELDYCRHFLYFKSVAWGGKASAAELELLTGCMREIRRLAEEIGRRRGRPILIAVRVPDSAGYCRDAGLDLETWMAEKLIDIYIGSYYLQLNPWEYSARLCRQYGVKFYPSLDESRMGGLHPDFARKGVPFYRGREAAALAAGADGIYYFNLERGHLANFRGGMDDIRFEDKHYFITTRDRPARTDLASGDEHDKLRRLYPGMPANLIPGVTQSYPLEFGDDFAAAGSRAATVTAVLQTEVDPGAFGFRINDTEVKDGRAGGGLVTYSVPAAALKPGVNQVSFTGKAVAARRRPDSSREILKGNVLLTRANQPPWRRLFRVHDYPNSETIVVGAYRLTDSGDGTSMANLLYPLPTLPAEYLAASFELKVEASTDPLGVVFRVADGKNVEIVTFEPGKVGLVYAGRSVAFDTAGFHHYRVELKEGRLLLGADGRQLIDAPLVMAAGSPEAELKDYTDTTPFMHDSSLLLGSLSGPGRSVSLWKNLRLHTGDSVGEIKDFMLKVTYPGVSSRPDYGTLDPAWLFDFRVVDGKFPADRRIRRTYNAANRSIVDDGDARYIRFEHRAGAEIVMATDPALLETKRGVFIAEWQIRYLGDVGEKSSFLAAFFPRGAKEIPLFAVVNHFDRKVRAPWGEIKLPRPLSERPARFRLVIDLAGDEGSLYLDGALLGSGKVPARTDLVPQLYFGDGSVAVEGVVDLEFLRAAVVE